MHDEECKEYINSGFSADLLKLIVHDKAEFDRPPKWKSSDVLLSPLFTDFGIIWNKISGVYTSEVGALSYGVMPTSDEIMESSFSLFIKVKRIIEDVVDH